MWIIDENSEQFVETCANKKDNFPVSSLFSKYSKKIPFAKVKKNLFCTFNSNCNRN